MSLYINVININNEKKDEINAAVRFIDNFCQHANQKEKY